MFGDDLNRSFPEVKPTTVDEFIEKWWNGVGLGEPFWVEDKVFGAKNFAWCSNSAVVQPNSLVTQHTVLDD